MEKRQFAAGEAVYNSGDVSDQLYLVKSGKVPLKSLYPETGEATEEILGPGRVFGEVELIDGRPRSLSAKAASDCLLISFERDEILDILFNRPEDSLVLGKSVFDHLKRIYSNDSLESDLARLREEMNTRIREAVIQHESRVVRSHNGMAAIAVPIVVLIVLAIGAYFFVKI